MYGVNFIMMFSKDFFAARLKEVRNGLTQAQAAQKVGLSQQGWARYESGKVLPGAEAIHQICSSFGASADWLLGLSPPGGSSVVAPNNSGAIASGPNAQATLHAAPAVPSPPSDCARCLLMQEHIRRITGRG